MTDTELRRVAIEKALDELESAYDVEEDGASLCTNLDRDRGRAILEALVKGQLQVFFNAPPAQMSYGGELVPVNSTGMRRVIDDASALLADKERLDWLQSCAGEGWLWFADRGSISAVVSGRKAYASTGKRDFSGAQTVRAAIDAARDAGKETA